MQPSLQRVASSASTIAPSLHRPARLVRSVHTRQHTAIASFSPLKIAPSSTSPLSNHLRKSTPTPIRTMSTEEADFKPLSNPQLPPSIPSGTTPKLHLYTAGTPNGYKVSILLEELVLAYPELVKEGTLAYDFYALSFQKNEQKSAEFLKINPNGRIPALVDDNQGGHNIFETASILIWLVENYDKDNHFWFSDPLLRSKALSWIFFGHGGVGPMQGQANHFHRYAPEKIPYGVKRYQDETRRLYSVLEDGLKLGKGEWLVGDKFSIVDISIFGWVNSHAWAGLEDISEFPLLIKWIDRIRARKGADNGLGIPTRGKRADQQSKEDQEKQAKEASAWVMAGQPK